MDSPERRERLERSAERLLEMIQGKMPDVMIARECVIVFRHAIATFEREATDVFSNWLIRSVRVSICQCPSCGMDLGEKRGGAPVCATCSNAGDLDFLKATVETAEFDKNRLKPDE